MTDLTTDATHIRLTVATATNPALSWLPSVSGSLATLAFAGLSGVHVAKTSWLGSVLSETLPRDGFTTVAR
jgi:hypothetical protein